MDVWPEQSMAASRGLQIQKAYSPIRKRSDGVAISMA
jgi:hypothetical protein